VDLSGVDEKETGLSMEESPVSHHYIQIGEEYGY
jgi:hypothetical protein